jgi:hypothetical protein
MGQHEKKTNTRSGHEDIVELVKALDSSEGEAQWLIIKKHFDVKQVATYFAVNTVLSHWDGFFNNYFTYHDLGGSGKWTMYPWDQDQTWGIMNHQPGTIVYDIPITFGMNGAIPPGERKRSNGRNRFAFGQGQSWWRPPGFFSGPLLANARFRELFLARTHEILESIYTAENFFPVIEDLRNRLQDEVKARAAIIGSDPNWELKQFTQNIELLKTHLTKRREFLLEQKEVKEALRMK